jgi:hypothetical protein
MTINKLSACSLSYCHIRFGPIKLVFIEVPEPRQERERSCICVLEVSIFPLLTTVHFCILLLNFGIVLTVWYILFFTFSMYKQIYFIEVPVPSQ